MLYVCEAVILLCHGIHYLIPSQANPLPFKNRHLFAIHGRSVSFSVIKVPYAELTCGDLLAMVAMSAVVRHWPIRHYPRRATCSGNV